MTEFQFNTDVGSTQDATLTLTPTDSVDGFYIVTPTFYVDFGKEVLNIEDAENALKLFTSTGQEFHSLVKTWTTYKRRVTLTCPTKLKGDTTYVLSMNPVMDFEGCEIIPFPSYTFTTLYNGTGSASSPFYIYTAKQLDEVRLKPTYYYRLARDLDIATSTYISKYNTVDKGWLPIGNMANKFTGGFDGNGHKITGLSINRTATDSVGLFGQIDTATIKNLYVANGIVVGQDSVGGIIGYSYNSTINNCCNESVTVVGENYVGGICGNLYSTKVNNCRNEANVNCNHNMAGGITGWTKNYSQLNACSNTGYIISYESHSGGITGYNNGWIMNCYNGGTAMGYTCAGGIVGSNNTSATVDRCYSLGDARVTSPGENNYEGAIGGYCESTAHIRNCFITSDTSIGGYPCANINQIIGNFNDPNNLDKNYLYTSISQINIAVSTAANWYDGELWDHQIWLLSNLDYPRLKNMP